MRPQARADQTVVHQHQALGQRHADVVPEFLGCGAGAPSEPSTMMKSG